MNEEAFTEEEKRIREMLLADLVDMFKNHRNKYILYPWSFCHMLRDFLLNKYEIKPQEIKEVAK